MDAELVRKYGGQATWLQQKADIESVCRLLAERDRAQEQVANTRRLFLHPSDPLPNLTQRQREAYDALAHGADSTTWARNASISADYAREIVAGLAQRLQVEGQTGVRLHFLARLWETLA